MRKLFFPWIEKAKEISNLLKYYFRDLSSIDISRGNVAIEASSMCQLKCPICPTSKGENKKGIVGWGYLKFNDFKKFIEKNPKIKRVELSNWGEMFLNPELGKIIKYAYTKKVRLTALNGVNLNNASKNILECIVKFKFNSIRVSIDGANNKTYKIYRKGGNFNNVIRNIKLINAYKKKHKTEFPKLSWQFVIMGHNEKELSLARKKAEKLGMKFMPKFNWDPSFSPIKDKEFVKKESGLNASSEAEISRKYKRKMYYIRCKQLWTNPQINWDGKLLGCCVNKFGDFGNVFEKGLNSCIKGRKYIYAKKMLLGKKKPKEGIPCSSCQIYKKTILKNPFTKKDILT